LDQVSETNDPETFSEALGHPYWDTTMNEEYHYLMENDTWDLVPLHKGFFFSRCKWVYKTKYASDGSVEIHKAWLVSKGFSQVEGIDYNETFSHVAKMNSIHLVLDLPALHKWEVHQVKQAHRAWYAKMNNFLINIRFSRCYMILMSIPRKQEAIS
jgi:hypothetical protein